MRSTNEALGNAVEYGNLYDNNFLLELHRRATPGEEKRGSQPLPQTPERSCSYCCDCSYYCSYYCCYCGGLPRGPEDTEGLEVAYAATSGQKRRGPACGQEPSARRLVDRRRLATNAAPSPWRAGRGCTLPISCMASGLQGPPTLRELGGGGGQAIPGGHNYIMKTMALVVLLTTTKSNDRSLLRLHPQSLVMTITDNRSSAVSLRDFKSR